MATEATAVLEKLYANSIRRLPPAVVAVGNCESVSLKVVIWPSSVAAEDNDDGARLSVLCL